MHETAKYLVGWAVPAGVVMGVWFYTFRRTKERVIWFIICALFAAGGVAAGLGTAAAGGTTVGGVLGVDAIFVLVALAFAALEESDALKEQNDTYKYRHRNGKRKKRKAASWWITNSHAGEQVVVAITDGEHTREIGRADPIKDDNAYMELKANAERAAENYNALKIK